MSSQRNSILTAFYRFIFLWYEPIACLSGFYVNTFDPDHFLHVHVPESVRNT